MPSPPALIFVFPTSAQDLPRKCHFARAQLPRIATASLVHRGQTGLAFSKFSRKGPPLCRSRTTVGPEAQRDALLRLGPIQVHNLLPAYLRLRA